MATVRNMQRLLIRPGDEREGMGCSLVWCCCSSPHSSLDIRSASDLATETIWSIDATVI